MKSILKEELRREQINEEESSVYYYYILSIKELMILYREQKMYEYSQKFQEILEEENID
jgi:hypothetical protein